MAIEELERRELLTADLTAAQTLLAGREQDIADRLGTAEQTRSAATLAADQLHLNDATARAAYRAVEEPAWGTYQLSLAEYNWMHEEDKEEANNAYQNALYGPEGAETGSCPLAS